MQSFQQIRRQISRGELPSDEWFHSLLPSSLNVHANRHFADIYAISLATKYLVAIPEQAKILDIGSGVGKFCLLGALFHEEANFTGVEYRDSFYKISEDLRRMFSLKNVRFYAKNILDHPFSKYTGIFLFNPFLEHRNADVRMPEFTDDPLKEKIYFDFVKNEFSRCKKGVRLVTLYVDQAQVPPNFKLIEVKMGGTLRFYECQ